MGGNTICKRSYWNNGNVKNDTGNTILKERRNRRQWIRIRKGLLQKTANLSEKIDIPLDEIIDFVPGKAL